MNYKEINDNELIYLCNENNEIAFDTVIDKYKNCILNILKEYIKKYNVIGVEIADLYQEGLLGLIKAIRTYDEKKDALFYTYANACIRKNIINAIKKTFEKKHRILNNSYSLDYIINGGSTNYYETFKDESYEPNRLIMDKEEENEIIDFLKTKLSNKELEVFELKLKGLKNSEICKILDKDKKYIENTLFRINRKYKEYFNKVNA